MLHLQTIHNGSAGLKQSHKSKWHYHLRHENGNTDQADDTMWDACLWSLQLNQSRMTASTWANCFCAWMNVYLEHHLSPHNSVCVCVRARARVDARMFWMLHVFAGVRLWKKPGRARGGENVRVRYIYFFYVLFYCYFKCTFLSLEPMCQRKILIFMLCILMTNKDLID